MNTGLPCEGILLQELSRHGTRSVVRVCEPTYATKPLVDSGIDVLDWEFGDGQPPPPEVSPFHSHVCASSSGLFHLVRVAAAAAGCDARHRVFCLAPLLASSYSPCVIRTRRCRHPLNAHCNEKAKGRQNIFRGPFWRARRGTHSSPACMNNDGSILNHVATSPDAESHNAEAMEVQTKTPHGDSHVSSPLIVNKEPFSLAARADH